MTPERWQQIDALFRSTLELEEARQERFLAESCADDPELYKEVASLLAADRRVDHSLEQAVAAEAADLKRSRAKTREGETVGAYEISGLLGKGGMGAVYLATRADRSYKKSVAIKILKRGMDSDEILSRFLQERQILASFEHPNIARLIDAATTDDGLPCLIMEYVEGLPVDRFCRENRLRLGERLELFLTICSAVQAAHRNLIVHRDLKPSNILVTAEGIPKLLDFGIAKLLHPSTVDTAVANPGFRALTPDYASPEQLRGDAITTASDVYSLGVLLFRLLTGRLPYVLPHGFGPDSERIVGGQIPRRASSAVRSKPDLDQDASAEAQEPLDDLPLGDLPLDDLPLDNLFEGSTQKLSKRLSGDLDTVIAKALSQEPGDRYLSVEALAEDIRRHLQGLPIVARPPSWTYRATKFVRRHRAGVTAAVLVLLAISSGFAATTRQAHIAGLERQRAEAEKDRAETVSSFLEEMFQGADPHQTPGQDLTARQLLDRGAERLSTTDWQQPEVQARLMNTVGRSYQGLGLYDRAEEFLSAALEIRQQNADPLEIADSFDNLGSVLQDLGKYPAAAEAFREALTRRRQGLGPHHLLIAESLNNLAQAQLAMGDHGAAEPLLRQALDLKLELLGPRHLAVANGYNNLAGAVSARGDHGAAADLFRRALDLRTELLGDAHPAVAESLVNLGASLYRRHHYSQAEPLFRRALDLRRELFGSRHPAVARSLSNLASVLIVLDEPEQAEPLLLESLAMKTDLLGEEHPSLASTLIALGTVFEFKLDLRGAEAHYLRALDLRRASLPSGHLAVAPPALALGQLYLDQGDAEKAEPLIRESLDIRRANAPGSWLEAQAQSAFGGLLATSGEVERARALLTTACATLTRELGAADRRNPSGRGSTGRAPPRLHGVGLA